jgi:hypothetical protein
MTAPARIAVLSVSWHSAEFLRALCANLMAQAEQPNRIRFLIADNTNGGDPALAGLDVPGLQIVPVDAGGERMSFAHAVGLNALFPLVDAPYTLVVDPDVIVFQPGWDTLAIGAVSDPDRPQVVAIGASYPPWKLGKYHDFPSPPFAFWRTDALRALDPDWRPYARTAARRLVDFGLRQAFWGPRLIDRGVLRLPRRQFRAGRWVERWTGVVSKDTGWQIAARARRRGWRADVFPAVSAVESLDGIAPEHRAAYAALAAEFELYAWGNRPFLTHRNPTRTQIGLNLWTNTNVTLYQDRTAKAAQTARWRALVAQVQAGAGESVE